MVARRHSKAKVAGSIPVLGVIFFLLAKAVTLSFAGVSY